MSAPSIPNLLSLRGSRGGRGRSRGRGGPSAPSENTSGSGTPSRAHHHDATIQGTDTDAAVSRLSAVELGYLEDPFAAHFVQASPTPSNRRLPIINRGTYTRTAALDSLINTFLPLSPPDSPSLPRQVISLGAGTDTRSFRLFSKPGVRNVTYHELDFPSICNKKRHTVQSTPRLRQIFTDVQAHEDGSWSCATQGGNQLWCHGVDLRHLAQSSDATVIQGLVDNVPTLLVSECCLCYLETTTAQAVIQWFASRIPNLGILVYEPIRPDDPFGRMMVSNLAARGIRMPSLEVFKTPEDQGKRLRDAGFDEARQLTVDEVWEAWISAEEKERVDGLEGLDEVEEWNLLASHYVVVWGWRGLGFEGWAEGTPR